MNQKGFKGTKGEWVAKLSPEQTLIEITKSTHVVTCGEYCVSIPGESHQNPEVLFNAHLIASAPDLLAACQSVLAVLQPLTNNPVHETVMAQLKSAISKALPNESN